MKTSLILLITIKICLLSGSLFAKDIDLNHILTEKKAIIMENMKLTEKEDKAFWPLYE
jgi:hypothetical protein